jgi:hypothetical protein
MVALGAPRAGDSWTEIVHFSDRVTGSTASEAPVQSSRVLDLELHVRVLDSASRAELTIVGGALDENGTLTSLERDVTVRVTLGRRGSTERTDDELSEALRGLIDEVVLGGGADPPRASETVGSGEVRRYETTVADRERLHANSCASIPATVEASVQGGTVTSIEEVECLPVTYAERAAPCDPESQAGETILTSSLEWEVERCVPLDGARRPPRERRHITWRTRVRSSDGVEADFTRDVRWEVLRPAARAGAQ